MSLPSRRFTACLFAAPYLIFFLLFVITPIAFGFVMSFFDWEMLSSAHPKFVGLSNFSEAFSDPKFIMALKVTFAFVLMTVPTVILSALLLAAAVSVLPRRQTLYRASLYLPVMINIVVASLLWRWLYNTEFGLFNRLLMPLGLTVPWLSSKELALMSIALMTVWWTTGVFFLILLTAFQQVPESQYEAADIDGATGFAKLRHIALPHIRPVLIFCIILETIASFKIFGQTYLMTMGGPESSTRVAIHYIYETAFTSYRMGYASALSWILFAILAVFGLIRLYFRRAQVD